jgi:hypothetical protein
VSYRGKKVTGLVGRFRYERAYYHGCGCEGGWAPADEELGLEDSLTPGAREVVALEGSLQSFDDAALKSLPKCAGLRVSAKLVERVTEAAGEDVARRREEGETFGDRRDWSWHRDAEGAKCAYVSLDATGVRQQAPDHKKADGRMVTVGEVFNPNPASRRKRGRRWEARYVAGLMSPREMGRKLRAEALSVGLERADVVIGLTDGGNGLQEALQEEVFAGLSQRIELILDFFHASEHVHGFVELLHPRDEAAAKQRGDEWCRTLKHAGGEALLRELEGLDLSGRSRETRESHRQLCNYFRNNLHRMDYPRYVARGWHIGSGAIESACKNVVNQRLNGTGMRWSERGTHHMAHLRALYKSEPSAWNDHWTRPPSRKAA